MLDKIACLRYDGFTNYKPSRRRPAIPGILGLGGSLREGSHTLRVLEIALEGARLAEAQTDLIDLKKLPLPFYDDRADIQSYPQSVFTLLEKIRWADGLILASPVYHGTLSGAMKNALDFLELLTNDDPPWLAEKVVGLISVAAGGHGVNTINSMLHTCRALHAWTLPTAVAVSGDAFDSEGRLNDAKIKERLLKLGREVSEYAAVLAQARARKRECK